MASKQLFDILSSLQNQFNGNLKENRSSLKELITILSELVESVADAKVKTPTWRYHSQTIIGRIIFTSHSILTLANGYEYSHYKRKNKVDVIDYPSIFVLTRTLIENYITLCYIYNNNLPDEERIFRYKLWEVSGLLSRQSWGKSLSDKLNKKKEEERILIDKIILEIEKMPEYSTLDKNQLSKLKKYGLPRLYSWNELIMQSNVRKEMFSSAYSYYSSYAHTEYISILQFSQCSINAISDKNISNIQLSLNIVRMIVAMSIDFYLNNFESAMDAFNTFPIEIKDSVNIWNMLGKQS
jgi:hypothetical protein